MDLYNISLVFETGNYDVALRITNAYIFYKYSMRFSVLKGYTICLEIPNVNSWSLFSEGGGKSNEGRCAPAAACCSKGWFLFKTSLMFVHVIIFPPMLSC